MQFSAPLKSNSKKIMLLGSGELGKEVVIEAQRLGLEVIAVDRYQNAPAHHVAHRAYVVNMQDKDAILEIDHNGAENCIYHSFSIYEGIIANLD